MKRAKKKKKKKEKENKKIEIKRVYTVKYIDGAVKEKL